MMDKMYGPPSIYTTSLQRDLLNGYIGKSVKANNGTEGGLCLQRDIHSVHDVLWELFSRIMCHNHTKICKEDRKK